MYGVKPTIVPLIGAKTLVPAAPPTPSADAAPS